jgi:Tfp pilus assembly PilM family ATPase
LFRKKLTTISVEGNHIRFLVLTGKDIKDWRTRKIPTELLSQGQIHNPDTIGNVIAATIKDLKGSKRNVVSSVTGQRSVHRIMRIPVVPDNLLEETIQRKAKQEFAIPIDESDIHWRILSKTDQQIVLYVLAVPSILVDSQFEALKAAKIKAKQMDIKPLALQRLVGESTGIIVNLEEFSLGVIIIANHIPILVRSVPLETSNVSAEAKTDLLSQELARTVKYYNESNKTNPLPEDTVIYLTGELFDTTQINARLDETADLSTRLQMRTPYSVQVPKTIFELPKDFSLSTYAVNLGLALKIL